MCLGVPGRIVQIRDGPLMRIGDVEFGSVTRQISLACVPEARLGDYVIVHAGFAIGRLDEAEARETLELLSSI